MSESPKWQWGMYYRNNPQNLPREPLLKALELFEREDSKLPESAIDIGCGHGPDTLELLKRGWSVLAIDGEQEGLKIIEETVPPEWAGRLELQQSLFENLKLGQVTLINASLSLPFCRPEYFDSLWNEIENSIILNGRFAGNLFGKRDSWAVYENMTFHSRSDIDGLFEAFDIEYLVENEYDGFASGGFPKHWHYYNITAKKKAVK